MTDVSVRPLLYVAGAAISTAGLCYLYNKFTDQQKTSVDNSLQTEPEDPVQEPQCNGELLCSKQTLRLFHKRCYIRNSDMLCVRRHFVLMTRGLVSQSWWILTNDFFEDFDEGRFRYASVHRVTVAQHVDGQLVRIVSYTHTEFITASQSHKVPGTNSYCYHKEIIIGNDGCLVSVPGATDIILYNKNIKPTPVPEPAEVSESLEAKQVPGLFQFCRTRGIENFCLKVTGLREAFNLLLHSEHNQMSLIRAGEIIFGELALANCRNPWLYQLAYKNLISAIKEQQHQIETELGLIGIQQFNFLDIVFELVWIGIFGKVRACQISPVQEGFLHKLVALISCCTYVPVDTDEPSCDVLLLIEEKMTMLLEDMFSMEESSYANPEVLAEKLWESFKYHIYRTLGNMGAMAEDYP